jgi:hypothetical protein
MLAASDGTVLTEFFGLQSSIGCHFPHTAEMAAEKGI